MEAFDLKFMEFGRDKTRNQPWRVDREDRGVSEISEKIEKKRRKSSLVKGSRSYIHFLEGREDGRVAKSVSITKSPLVRDATYLQKKGI